MNYSKFTVEDFVLDARFRKWILEEDPDLAVFWENFLKEYPHKTNDLKEAKKLLLYLPDIKYAISDTKAQTIWENVEIAIDNATQQHIKQPVVRAINSEVILNRKISENKTWFSSQNLRTMAASVLLIIAFAYGYLIFKENSNRKSVIENKVVSKTNPWGQKTNIYLSDGSEIILNAGSSVTYNEQFSPIERLIKLTGEAYFKIAKDTNRPFKVVSGEIVTIALGTEFNVNAYNENEITVALSEGKVQVERKEASNLSALLHPGEGLTFNTEKSDLTKFDFDAKKQLSWKEGIIYFNNASEGEVMSYLEKWYGVNIEVTNKTYKKWAFSGEFKNHSLESVLRSIGFTMGFKYQRNQNKIVITYKTSIK